METNGINYDIDEYSSVKKEIINYGNIDNTSEKDNRVYRVYAHICKINGKMYIGQTCRSLKVRSGKNGCYYRDSLPFSNAIKKYGWDNFKHIVLIDGLSKKMADIIEIELIKKYNTRNDNYGYNLGLGGSFNIESKPIYQYDLDGNFIKEYKSISDVDRAFNVDNHSVYSCLGGSAMSWHGYMWSFEKHDKISPRVVRGGIYGGTRDTMVYQYDLDGNYICEYKNSTKAAEAIGVKRPSAICECINGGAKSAHGFQWSYEKHDKLPKYEGGINWKKVYQYDLDGNFLQEYRSECSIKETLGKNVYLGNKMIIDGVMCSHNFYWTFEKLDCISKDTIEKIVEIKSKPNNSRARKVYKYSVEGKLVDIFDSVRSAARSTNSPKDSSSISHCCSGDGCMAHGFIWSYTELSEEQVVDIYHNSRKYKGVKRRDVTSKRE